MQCCCLATKTIRHSRWRPTITAVWGSSRIRRSKPQSLVDKLSTTQHIVSSHRLANTTCWGNWNVNKFHNIVFKPKKNWPEYPHIMPTTTKQELLKLLRNNSLK